MFGSNLSTVRSPKHNPRLGRRCECRHEIRGNALVQVLDAEDPDLVGKIFHARVINASTKGIRLTSDELMDSCLLKVRISVSGYRGKLYLMGQVIWASWEENGDFHMGVEILDRPDTDVEEWRHVHDR